jgi:RHS repeat-associated protein
MPTSIPPPGLGVISNDRTRSALGNRLTRNSDDYTYDDADQLTDVEGTSYDYDDNGNLIERGADTFTWDRENRMRTATVSGVTSAFVYNGDGVRVRQVADGTPIDYEVDVAAPLPLVVQDGTYSYVYGLDLIAAIDGSSNELYYLYDGLGSVSELTDDSGVETDSYVYDAFGAVTSSTGSTANDWLFTGEQEDGDTGLYFLRARYYDPETGRFLARDPMEFNQRYAYAGNNPVAYTDPSGLCPACAVPVAGAPYFIGAGVVAIGATIYCLDVECGVDTLGAAWRNFAGNTTNVWDWTRSATTDLGKDISDGAVSAWNWATDGDQQPDQPENRGNLDRVPDRLVPERLAREIKEGAIPEGSTSEWDIYSDGEWLWVQRKDRTGPALPTGWREDELKQSR